MVNKSFIGVVILVAIASFAAGFFAGVQYKERQRNTIEIQVPGFHFEQK